MANNTTITELPKDAWTCVDIHSINSDGLFKSEIDPFYYTVPIFLMQCSLSTFMNCIMSSLFLPLGIPAMVTQLMAGIALSPSMLGHIKGFQRYIFPPRSYILLRTFGNLGTIIQVFIMGVQTDPANFKPGIKDVVIGISVVVVPATLTTLVSKILSFSINDKTGDLIKDIALVGNLQSLTSFSVIARYLLELNILNTEFSDFAICTSMVSGTINTIVLNYDIARNYTNGVGVAMIATLAVVAVVTVVLLKTVSCWIIRKTRDGHTMKQGHLNIIIVLVLLTSHLGYRKNVHFLIAPFLAGLVIPSGPPLGSALIEKFSFYNKWMVMPIFYVAHGITMTDISETPSSTTFLFILIILISSLGKFLGAFLPALYYRMSYKDASLLGLAMNAQGFLEIVVFTCLRDLERISNECFTTLLLTMAILTGAAAPLMRYLYNTSLKYQLIKMRSIQHTEPNCELRVLGCVYEDENVPSMIDVVKATNATTECPIKLIIIHFVELAGGTVPLIISHKLHKNLPPAAAVSEPIVNVFKYYAETNKKIIAVHPYTVVSNYASMYNDLLALALRKKTSLIILPYHKSSATGYVNSGIRKVNYYILDKSPCSVGILIDRGLHNNSAKLLSTSWESYHVAVIFFGGADDREALAHAKRMSEHPAIGLTVFQFRPSTENGSDSTERSLDSAMIKNFKLETASNNRVRYIEEEVEEGLGVIKVIKSMEDKFDLIILGRHHDENLPLILELTDWNKCSELGTIADIFITSGYGGNATLLVIQQQSKVAARLLFRQDHAISKPTYDVDREESSLGT